MKAKTERIKLLTMTFDEEDIRRALALLTVFEYAYTPKDPGELRDGDDGGLELKYEIDHRDEPILRSRLFEGMVDFDLLVDDETPEQWAHRVYECIEHALRDLSYRLREAEEDEGS